MSTTTLPASRAGSHARRGASPVTGARRLVRLALRRDRVILPVWIAAIAALTWAIVGAYVDTLPGQAERVATAMFSAANPITRVFDGPAAGTEIGAMVWVEGYKILAMLVALMSAQTVVRHTRQDEETGRAELLGAGAVGRHARLTAALVVALGANVLLGGAVAGAFLGHGLAGRGSLVAGLAVTGTGWLFAGVAAVAAQVLSTARAANAATAAALGTAFVLRAIGDLTGEVGADGVSLVSAWPSWLSPWGWGQQMRPFQKDAAWIFLLFVALTGALVAGAFALAGRRDVGPGMITPRPGPAQAAPALTSVLGLAWRLQRGILAVWFTVLVGVGAAFGAVGRNIEELVGQTPQVAQLLDRLAPGAGAADLFFALLLALIGVATAAYAVQALLRMRAEEATGRLEPVLASPVGRLRWLASHTGIVAVGALATLAGSGLACGAANAATSDGSAVELVPAALVQVPAVLVIGALVVALFAVVPRWAGALAWGTLAGALVMGQFGALFELPQWLMNVSPFTHVPTMPAEAFAVRPVVTLLAVAVALGIGAAVVFRRRDLVIGA